MQHESNDAVSPDSFGRCTDCGKIYPVYESNAGRLHPAGTDGSCTCGNETFRRISV